VESGEGEASVLAFVSAFAVLVSEVEREVVRSEDRVGE